MRKRNRKQFVVCIRNKDYKASLQIMKIYERLKDPEAEKHGLIRVVDEDAEDHLYPASYFLPIELPPALEEDFESAPELQTA